MVGSSLSVVVGRSLEIEKNAQIQSQILSRGDEIAYLELDEEVTDDNYDRAWNLWKLQISENDH